MNGAVWCYIDFTWGSIPCGLTIENEIGFENEIENGFENENHLAMKELPKNQGQ